MPKKNHKAFSYGLTPNKVKYSCKDHVDYDYIGALNASERKWLMKFTGEFYGARKSKNPIHPDSYWKELYGNNNSRNRDITSSSKHLRVLDYLGLIDDSDKEEE